MNTQVFVSFTEVQSNFFEMAFEVIGIDPSKTKWPAKRDALLWFTSSDSAIRSANLKY